MKTAPTKSKVTPKAAKKVAKTPKVSLKARLLEKLQPVRSKFDNILARFNPRKKAKKLTKAEKKAIRRQKIRGIIGIGLLFVVVSIAYSTYMTNLFLDGTEMIIFLAPQVIFALAISGYVFFYAFYKN